MVWSDSTFETVERLLTVQRLSVDRFLESQHRIAGRFIDSGWALATAMSGAGLHGRARDVEDAGR